MNDLYCSEFIFSLIIHWNLTDIWVELCVSWLGLDDCDTSVLHWITEHTGYVTYVTSVSGRRGVGTGRWVWFPGKRLNISPHHVISAGAFHGQMCKICHVRRREETFKVIQTLTISWLFWDDAKTFIQWMSHPPHDVIGEESLWACSVIRGCQRSYIYIYIFYFLLFISFFLPWMPFLIQPNLGFGWQRGIKPEDSPLHHCIMVSIRNAEW